MSSIRRIAPRTPTLKTPEGGTVDLPLPTPESLGNSHARVTRTFPEFVKGDTYTLNGTTYTVGVSHYDFDAGIAQPQKERSFADVTIDVTPIRTIIVRDDQKSYDTLM